MSGLWSDLSVRACNPHLASVCPSQTRRNPGFRSRTIDDTEEPVVG